jgi:acyl-CoA reductase-like NAD-dependent aldehyde dehydrogenase
MPLGVEAKSKPSATPGARLFQTVNPAKGENGRAYEGHTIDQAKSIASDVYEAQIAWRRTLFAARSAMMVKAALVIRQNRDRYAKQEFLQQRTHARVMGFYEEPY